MKQYIHALLYGAFWAILTAIPALLSAQGSHPGSLIKRCATMEEDSILRAAHPELGTLADFEAWLAPHVQRYREEAAEDRFYGKTLDTHYISIVFHVIHNGESVGSGSNLSYNAILDQLRQLNADFNPNNPRYRSGSSCTSAGVNTEIIFCTPRADPYGNPYGGDVAIHRVNRKDSMWTAPPYSRAYINSTIKPAIVWDTKNYLNVWIVDLEPDPILGNLLGYATFPTEEFTGLDGLSSIESQSGVVLNYRAVGKCKSSSTGNGNRTLTHEVGHYLGLRHIWGDGNCDADDFCNDTPRAAARNYGCKLNANSCNDTNYGSATDPNDMVQNYMDYSDDACVNQFTNDQKMRMKAVLKYSHSRKTLSRWPCLPCQYNIQIGLQWLFKPSPEFRQSGNWIRSSDMVRRPYDCFYKAQDYVLLQEGFQAVEGSLFIASTGSCWKAPGTEGTPTKEGIPFAPVPEDERQTLVEMPDLQLRVFPNPFRDEITVEFDNGVPEGVQMQLFDARGRVVTQLAPPAGGEDGTLQRIFRVEDLPAGIYFLQVRAGQAVRTEKLVKQW